MAAFGESHHLFMLCPPSTTATKQTAEAAAQHKQELTQTQCSLLVFKLGNVLNFGQLLHLPKFLKRRVLANANIPLGERAAETATNCT